MFGAVLGMSDQSSLPGWVDNVNNGGVAFMAGVGRGVFRTIGARQDLIADMVPCDQLASLLIAAAWAAYKERDLKVYHFTSGTDNPLTWSEYGRYVVDAALKHPCTYLVMYPRAKVRNIMRNSIYVVFGHYLPGVLLDLLASLHGRKPILMEIQRKYSRGMKLSAYFTTNEWKFHKQNTNSLARKLTGKDKTEFSFDTKDIKWPSYLETCVLGVRKYYHGEEPDSITRARKFLFRWRLLDAGFSFLMFILLWFVIYRFYGQLQFAFLAASSFFILYLVL
ncbi:putative fatty acyl-CoA reductase CG5065 isoform X1 [Rhodnius prolixus]|uniref:putative fatty acyl-CoA reductase CG5065 isoform X1 n=1 Tax=Rhodnius prolixus TaxID=13249 RepID=UPI003D18F357